MNGMATSKLWIGDTPSLLAAVVKPMLPPERSEFTCYSHWPIGPQPHSYSDYTTPVKKPRTSSYKSSPGKAADAVPLSLRLVPTGPATSDLRGSISSGLIQQRLVELHVKEKSLIEERQILTEQLSRLLNQDPDVRNSENFVNSGESEQFRPNAKRSLRDEVENIEPPEVLSVLSPASQRVLQQVLQKNNSTPTVPENPVRKSRKSKQESSKIKIYPLGNDSPYKPKQDCKDSGARRQMIYENTAIPEPVEMVNPAENDGDSLESRKQSLGREPLAELAVPNAAGSEGLNEIPGEGDQRMVVMNSPPMTNSEQKLSLAISDPSYSSLQRLSRRVKIVMKPSGQIFPRSRQRVNQRGLFNPTNQNFQSLSSTPLKENITVDSSKPTDVFDDNNNDDNWLSWDES